MLCFEYWIIAAWEKASGKIRFIGSVFYRKLRQICITNFRNQDEKKDRDHSAVCSGATNVAISPIMTS